MKKLSFYVTALVASVLASCSNVEDVQTSQNEMEDFVAVVAEGGTRTVLDGNAVKWDGEDALAIFRKTGKGINTKYVLKTIDSEGKATFKYGNEYSGDALSANLDYNYAVYPYSNNITMTTAGIVNVTIPEKQTYTTVTTGSGDATVTTPTFDPAAAFMFAANDGTALKFKNAHALLKIALTKMPGDDDYSITSIKLSSTTGKLSGNATIKMENGEPKIEISGTTGKNLQLDCENGVLVNSLDASKPAVFYLVVTPGTYSDLKLTLTGSNYTKELVLPENLNIARNNIVTIQHTCGSDDFTGEIPELGSTETNVNP